MATGKDRLQFPELPDEIPEGTSWKNWMSLNEVICNICDPKLSKRTINSSQKLAESLAKIKQGKKIAHANRANLKKGLVAVLALGLVGYIISQMVSNEEAPVIVDIIDDKPPIEEPKYQFKVCGIQFASDPAQAEIEGHLQGVYLETPTEFIDYPPGTELNLTFKLEGYRPLEKKFIVPDKQLDFVSVTLNTFRPPKENQDWFDSVGARYYPRPDGHESGYIRRRHFENFLKTKVKTDKVSFEKYSERGEEFEMVLMTAETAQLYVSWIEEEAQKQGLLEDDQYIDFIQDESLQVGPADKLQIKEKRKQYATRCIVKEIPYATIDLTTEPLGARVYIDDKWVGETPVELSKLRPGLMKLELVLDGYKSKIQDLVLSENELLPLTIELEKNNGVVFGQPWKNSMEVNMVPFADDKLASVWEVRVSDYKKFTDATKYRKPAKAYFPQDEDHPVVGVNKKDAEAFCKWLSEKERGEDRIREHHEYRLPTDAEWSALCGLNNEVGDRPIKQKQLLCLNLEPL